MMMTALPPYKIPDDTELFEILSSTRTIAMVGASANPDRPSHGIMDMLMHAGYRVIPVNPGEDSVLGQKAYPSLSAIPEHIDMVNVFRRPAMTPDVAAEAVRIGAKTLWLQLGIYNEDAYRIAQDGGLTVIMDSCIAVVHRRLRVPVRAHEKG